jgi:HEPN domain-containing protein
MKFKITSTAGIAQNWLKQSRRFLDAAIACKDISEASLSASQLAAEQALKACTYLTLNLPEIEEKKELKRHFHTHNHKALLSRLPPEVITVDLQKASAFLGGLLDRTRYPIPYSGKPPYDIFNPTRAQEGIEAAELIHQFATRYVTEVSAAISRCVTK